MRTTTTTTVLFLLLAVFAALLALQVFLSRRESRWAGLVLPILFFLFSLLYPLNMMAGPWVLFQILIVLLLANIPTILLLAIYFGCREKRRREAQIEKMNIQDLD